jgi:NCAIR mutase (PurE)-related protein
MSQRSLIELAERFAAGNATFEELSAAVLSSRSLDLGDVQLDLDRRRRCGYPEVVFGQGKSAEALGRAVSALLQAGCDALVTRLSPEQGASLTERFPAGRHNPVARTFRVTVESEPPPCVGQVAVITAGTGDLPVAEEARETLAWMRVEAVLVHDVGVAGPHRLPAQLSRFESADAVVVVAGMEGALPSVVGGYVSCPVIAVPTSVGYGASLGGIAALLSMLNSCAANVSVVNIDAGFKAGYVAGLIASRAARRHEPKH